MNCITLHKVYCRAQSDGGIVVSMVAFQAVDPGSIPGHRSTSDLFNETRLDKNYTSKIRLWLIYFALNQRLRPLGHATDNLISTYCIQKLHSKKKFDAFLDLAE